MTEKLLTPLEVSQILQVSYETALDFIKHSGIDYIKIGRQYRVDETKLNEFVTQNGKVIVNLTNVNIYPNSNTRIKIRRKT